MGKYFCDKVEEGIYKVWMTFDKEAMQQGFGLLKEAAEEGNADGYCFLARCYMGRYYVWNGGGLPEDDAMAAKLVKESILRGSAAGILCGMRSGELTPAVRKQMPLSLKEAFGIVLDKAEAGHPFCQYIIGNAYYWGDMLEIEGKDEMMKRYPTEKAYEVYAYPIAAGWYMKAFKNGVTFGFGNFRTICEKGFGKMPPDPGLADKWMKVIADAGDPVQQCNYGCLLDERGDYSGAKHYYELSASKGNVVSCYNLACCYNRGKGMEVDKDKAFRWFMAAAEAGDSDAQFQVGNFYFEGIGSVKEDNAKAAYWLQKSADQGNECAYPQLAMCYCNGWGVELDAAYGFYLYTEAEKHLDMYGDTLKGYVLNGLGYAYAFADGAEEDIERGIGYFNAAVEVGNTVAIENLSCFKRQFRFFGKWVRC